ncbi:hypothetical protein BASA50_006152 [Batrachochytrium salamandrivorans]|uniref:Extracellular metalloproteinase n=1 Tax=Batrachochytrium salamandrivorans TaxID=1357716 RepID=A0ABQ8FDV4_9FUNG|nr:hypothetical protein BASA50_006152 [Batrachochytrium salamandrivorans]
MVAVSFVLVLALVSSTVVAQPGKNRIAGLVAYFKQRAAPMAPKTSTTSVYEWIPPRKWALKLTSNINSVKIGLKYILKQLDLQPNGFKVMTSFTDNLGITHVYGEPLHEGLPIGNLHAAAHVKNGQVFFHSATIMDDRRLTQRSPTIPESRAKLSSKEAVKAAVDYLKVPFYHDIAPVMESYKTGNGHIPVWKFQLRDTPITQWLEVRVDANTENLQASPYGWTDGYRLTGNNVWASTEGGKIFKTTTRGIFNMEFDPTSPPQTPKNLGAGGVNAFYVTNTFHDVFYAYGFNEPAGNFQQNNFDKGGRDGDPVIINVQISKETNNAYFHTPPDGYPGVLTLHIFTNTEPNRDPALDNTMLIHELTHGLNDRLTGGAHEDLCMTETESLGLGEGYSDMVALIFMAKPEDTRDTKKVIGEYVKGDPKGIRKYPYTTNMRFNPLTYKDAVGEKQRHALGEIWATMLLEVYWSLVDEYGFSANLHDATQEQGNIIFLQLLVGTMMIQPCNPTFESAYDAMLAADYAYYGGIHKHLIRKGFSKRGLGPIS